MPNRAYVTVFGPVLRVLNALSNAGVRLLGVEPRDELATAASADELAVMLGASRDEGLIEEVAHQLLTGALDLGDRSIATVMVPRDGVVWLPRTATPAEAEALVVASGPHPAARGRRRGRRRPRVRPRQGPAHPVRAGPRTGRCRSGGCGGCSCSAPRPRSTTPSWPCSRPGSTWPWWPTATAARSGIATLEDVIEALVGDIRDESDR